MSKNRSNNREKKFPVQGEPMPDMKLINLHSAGIDVGSMLMMVSYADKGGLIHLAEFDGFTDSLQSLGKLLKSNGVEKVAMEATGVYWMSLYQLLESLDITVILINPRHYKNVEQKTDVKDCQWLHQLLAFGMIKPSHIASELYRELRHYMGEREINKKQKSSTLNRIQKILTLMNVKFQHVISDIEGVEAMKVLRAIAAGTNDAETLVNLMDTGKLKATDQELIRSLQGHYHPHLVRSLKLLLETLDFVKQQMKKCEGYIREVLTQLLPERADKQAIEGKGKKSSRKNEYEFNVKDYLKSILQVDVTKVPGMEESTVLSVLSVTGSNMNKWPTGDHFTSWLRLAPRPKRSGGKVIGHEHPFTNNPATQAFRMAANALRKDKSPLGVQYRKLAARKGAFKAKKAFARKLAIIFYNMVSKKEPYNETKWQQAIMDSEKIKLRRLQKEAAKYGCRLEKVA